MICEARLPVCSTSRRSREFRRGRLGDELREQYVGLRRRALDSENAARPAAAPAARKTTIPYLITRPAPAHLPDARLPFERRVFTVVAAVTLIRPEDDSDLHVILRQGGNHMISEAPAPYCTRRATPLRRSQMR